MPPRKVRLSPEERTLRAITRMSAGTVAGRIESASPVRRSPDSQIAVPGTAHTHDGVAANTTIVGGVAEAGSAVPVAPGTESVVIGDFAGAPGAAVGRVVIGAGTAAGQYTAARTADDADGAIVIGGRVSSAGEERAPYAGGYADIVIGIGAETAGGTENTVIGKNAEALGAFNFGNVVVGSEASVTAPNGSAVAVGFDAIVQADFGVAVGEAANVSGKGGVAVGEGALVTAVDGVAIGFGDGVAPSATVTHARSVAIGSSAVSSATDQVAFDKRHIELEEIAADPATPAANHIRIYCKDSGGVSRLFYIDDGGTVRGPL